MILTRILCTSLGLIATQPASAQSVDSGTFISDAFGLYPEPPQGGTDDRAVWAGLRETLRGGAVAPKTVQPGLGADILFHLGEKSLTAAGAMGQVAAVVLDKHGNLVADGTMVTLTTDKRRAKAPTIEGIAASLFEPGSNAGSYHAGAAIEGLQSGRVEYQVYADLGSLRPMWSGADRPWLPEDFVEFSSAPLVDKFGNPAFDGLGVTFRLDHSDRRVTQVSGFTVGGVARSRLLSRDIPSSGALSMTIADKVAPPDIVSFLPQVMEGTVTVEPVFDLETETAVLRLGPFQTTLGYALNDGAAVQVEMTTVAGTVLTAEAWVLDGRSIVSFPMTPADFPAKARIITVLGETRVTISVANEKEGAP